jgi:response regulator of citrate/malate metabolism
MDSVRFLHSLDEISFAGRILVLSDAFSAEIANDCMRWGVNVCLERPFSLATLRRILNQFCRELVAPRRAR